MSWLTKRAAAHHTMVEFFESYLRWREACEDVRAAHEWWANCAPSQRILGFMGYREALDREERLALAHSHLAERLASAY